ncbi:MAG: thioesterase family protein [Clostridiales bacterium]|nr:thioesterase family protein [Clostridiales bacterium]
MKVGLSHDIEEIVTEDKTALAVGSGSLSVYATPAMIALMEKTAALCVESYLDDGYTSVGISLSVQHHSATPVGKRVSCSAALVEIDGRRLVFDVQVFDDAGLIGSGKHERFVVNIEKFLNKCRDKYSHKS